MPTTPRPNARRLVAEYQEKFANPFVAAETGYVDEVIMPRLLRRKLVAAFALLAEQARLDAHQEARKHPAVRQR